MNLGPGRGRCRRKMTSNWDSWKEGGFGISADWLISGMGNMSNYIIMMLTNGWLTRHWEILRVSRRFYSNPFCIRMMGCSVHGEHHVPPNTTFIANEFVVCPRGLFKSDEY